jgi:hypothetical protein
MKRDRRGLPPTTPLHSYYSVPVQSGGEENDAYVRNAPGVRWCDLSNSGDEGASLSEMCAFSAVTPPGVVDVYSDEEICPLDRGRATLKIQNHRSKRVVPDSSSSEEEDPNSAVFQQHINTPITPATTPVTIQPTKSRDQPKNKRARRRAKKGISSFRASLTAEV